MPGHTKTLQHNLEDDESIEPPVSMEIGFSKIIVVDNIPVVPQAKFEKLTSVLKKIFNAIGPQKQLYLPTDDTGTTKGYAFVEFETEEIAQSALEKTDGYRLDKNHIFKVTSYEDFEKYEKVDETYQPPQTKTFEPGPDLRWWVLDDSAIDQYCIGYQDWTEIYWNDLRQGEEPRLIEQRHKWTEAYVAWSPRGSYLLTVHPAKGVTTWAGPKFERMQRFHHAGVKYIDFSPCEKYLVTAAPQYQENDNPKDPQCIIVWDVRTGEKLRGFLGGNAPSWPVFKWSHDDKYFGRISEEGVLSLYQTPGMGLLDKKSIKIPGLRDFAWSPSDNIISYFVPEANEKPATVVLMEVPAKKEIRQKNLFNVKDCKLHWHPSGNYLCVKVDRMSKSKKSTYTNFELFRMREKEIPIELVDMKEAIIAFAWEPKGTRFAIVHGDGPRNYEVSFYNLEKKGQVKLLKTLDKRPVNSLFWSPQGSFIVLGGVGNLNGQLEFFNVNEMETMGTEEHFNTTSIEWDPSGRYVASVASAWRHNMETGYNIYSFTGKPLKHVLKDRFYQLLWRPRPPTPLSEERQKHISKNINQYASEFKAKDRERKEKARMERKRIRLEKQAAFRDFYKQKQEKFEKNRELRRQMRGEDSENEDEISWKEEWVETVEDYKEVSLPN